MKKVLAIVILALMPSWAKGSEPAPEILGVRLGMDHAKAHARLTKLAQFKSEDERQEVWTLRQDKRYQYLIVGFDREHKVRYVTAVARPRGQSVDYNTIGDLASAERREAPGNIRYIWRPKKHENDLEFLIIARGQEPHRLSMYSVKRVGTNIGREDD
jgi:hypothetical protein